MLQIYVDSIRSLDPKFKPFVRVSIGEDYKETSATSMKNGLVTFDKHLNFLVENPVEKSIEVQILDQTSSVEIDEFNYKIDDLLVRKNFEHELQSFPLVRGQNCEVILALKLNLLKTPEDEK